MNNSKKFAFRITALLLCLFTISAGLSSCGYFTESYLASFTEGPSKTQERVEFTYPEIIDFTPETTYVPETIATPETTSAPETTDNIPDDVQDNIYLAMMNNGRCEKLVGKVTVTVVTVSDEVSAWNDSALSELSASLSAQEKEIEDLAASYGKSLDLTFSYLNAKITGDAAKGDYSTEWIEAALSNAGLPTLKEAGKQLDSQNGADSNPMIFALNKSGRAYAQQQTSKNNTEFAVVFSSDLTSFTHEFYHIYGAEDFYFPELVTELANNYLTDSIMNSGKTTDPLTAFIIGWDEEMDAEALEFLKQTNHLTNDYIVSEREKQSVTGYVTDHKLGYGTYTGNLERGTPDGEGEIIYTDGDRYKGTFDGGSLHGKGTYTWVDGGVYEGDWVHGERTGKGSYTWPNGDRFVGNWVNGTRTGEGTLTFADGTVYKGNWENDAWNGKGKMTWTDGSYYEGDYKDGDRHGKGTFHYANGNEYVGDWVKGERVGQGTFTFVGGTVYVGSFVDGDFSGKGKMTWTDGSCYEGEFKNGDRHGQGKYTYAAGHVYVGEWANGDRNGYGKMTWADRSSYDGNWKDNKRHGYGKYINQYGQTFDGQWQNDVFQG
ncbi:MAG: hypothetical protein IJB43_01580 [Clostridia bacterium]|nr:hypothetical protein [Clostridia bacterium]